MVPAPVLAILLYLRAVRRYLSIKILPKEAKEEGEVPVGQPPAVPVKEVPAVVLLALTERLLRVAAVLVEEEG